MNPHTTLHNGQEFTTIEYFSLVQRGTAFAPLLVWEVIRTIYPTENLPWLASRASFWVVLLPDSQPCADCDDTATMQLPDGKFVCGDCAENY